MHQGANTVDSDQDSNFSNISSQLSISHEGYSTWRGLTFILGVIDGTVGIRY